MANKVFNTAFENMLRLLLLVDTLNGPANADRLAALDFICIYGKKCKVLDRNLHGDNAFGFAEFANKREKIRGCDKMCNHFATAFFLLEYSIRGLSNMCIYWFCLKTTKPRFTRELQYSPASPGPSPSEQG